VVFIGRATVVIIGRATVVIIGRATVPDPRKNQTGKTPISIGNESRRRGRAYSRNPTERHCSKSAKGSFQWKFQLKWFAPRGRVSIPRRGHLASGPKMPAVAMKDREILSQSPEGVIWRPESLGCSPGSSSNQNSVSIPRRGHLASGRRPSLGRIGQGVAWGVSERPVRKINNRKIFCSLILTDFIGVVKQKIFLDIQGFAAS